ncbi:LysR family transcriptional regulator [Butyrivibrio sp. JL13D10]|uniref:LysR family transcriptional regulator n=1 Tax=Butyrivibrio sp. JL13D10 TaxID=3236815 RepID=UPI0038B52474
MMDLKQMEYFKTIVDAGSINRAAGILHMSQPPLSMSMRKLEEELGVVLLTRGSRQITLTEAGAIFYQHATRILKLTDAAVTDVIKAGQHRSLSLGLTPSTIPVVSDTLAMFSDRHPDVRFQIYDGSTFELQQLLDTNVIDAAFLRTPITEKNFEEIPIRKEPMVAALPKALIKSKNNFKSDKAVSLEVLSEYPLSIYRRYHTLLTEAFQKKNLEPNFFSICDDTRTALLWAKNNKAVAIFPKSLEKECGKGLIVCPIDEDYLQTTILFVHKKECSDLIESLKSLL